MTSKEATFLKRQSCFANETKPNFNEPKLTSNEANQKKKSFIVESTLGAFQGFYLELGYFFRICY